MVKLCGKLIGCNMKVFVKRAKVKKHDDGLLIM